MRKLRIFLATWVFVSSNRNGRLIRTEDTPRIRRDRGLSFLRMPQISSLTIRRFKRLEQFTLNNLGETLLLIGANNSGKSSVLQAVHFAVSIAQSARLVGEGVAWRNDAFELSFNPSQLIYSPVADVLSLSSGGSLREGRDTQIESSSLRTAALDAM